MQPRLPRWYTSTSWRVAQTCNPVATLAPFSTAHGVDKQHVVAIGRDETVNSAFHFDSEWSVKTRHALRAILRECSYLPDPHARTYVSQYAVSRFKAYSFKAWKKRHDLQLPDRLRNKHLEAHRAFGQLRRANEGERKLLLKVLLLAYGRIGKRRQQLLQPLLPTAARKNLANRAAPENSSDEFLGNSGETNLSDSFQHQRPPVVKPVAPELPGSITQARPFQGQNGQVVQLSPILHALALSQMCTDVPDLTRSQPRDLKPEIPALDSQMRPLAASRVKNITKKWYADLLNRILPPLPAEEWRQLQQLALGVGILAPSPRRRKARSSADTKLATSSDALEAVVLRAKVTMDLRMLGNRSSHTITPRYLQRLYAQVFAQCPLMEWDTQRNKWNITWGIEALHSRDFANQAISDTVAHAEATVLPR